jgi:hypothetical protein
MFLNRSNGFLGILIFSGLIDRYFVKPTAENMKNSNKISTSILVKSKIHGDTEQALSSIPEAAQIANKYPLRY